MSGREFAQLTRMSRMSKVQERCLGAGETLFIEPLQRIEPLAHSLGSAWGDRMHRWMWPDIDSQRLVIHHHWLVLFKFYTLDHNGRKRSARSQTIDWTRSSRGTDDEPRSVRSSPVSSPRQFQRSSASGRKWPNAARVWSVQRPSPLFCDADISVQLT
jgi:hypothetical protein